MDSVDVSVQKLGHAFIDAFNRRDPEALVKLADPAIEFSPTGLVGARRTYHGHEGLRAWVSDLEESPSEHQVRVREVRLLEDERMLVLSEVLLDGEHVTASAMIARLNDTGKIVEAQAYLSDEEMLRRTGLLGAQAVSPA
jgi:hypothetical protein